ncbi:glycosyltransferase family 4 protein [Mesorhizobium sp. KR2-14]|uniref:glycosyltransferase family 4 protein n=1 Tax=Mesorhizobium sp. KR2-14 TaxID=3156610 RepID=UPI0032B5A3E0
MIDRRILQEALSLREAGYQVELLAGFECPQEEAFNWQGIGISRHAYDWSDTRARRVLGPISRIRGQLPGFMSRAVGKAIGLATGISSFEHFVLEKILSKSFDVLHVHDFPLLAVAVEVKRRLGCPLVYDAHELYHAQSQLPPAVQTSYKRREAALIHKVDAAITVNEFIAGIMARDYGCAAPHVIPNAAPRLEAAPEDIRPLAGLAPGTRIVLYQGWLSPERGVDVLVRAATHFPRGTSLVVVGYGAHEADLRRISAGQGTDDGRVVFLGRIEPQQLQSLTGSADLGVIPYWGIDLNNTYCSPNKLFEFAAAGLPFISNDLPFLRSITERHAFGVLVDLLSPQTAASAILAILDDPQRLAALRETAKEASNHLLWSNEAEKLLSIYATLR